MLDSARLKDANFEETLAELNDQTSKLNDIRDDIEQAEEAIRVYRDRIQQLEDENDNYA